MPSEAEGTIDPVDPSVDPMNGLAPRARVLFHLQAFSQLLFLWTPLTIGVIVVSSLVANVTTGLVVGSLLFLFVLLASVWFPSLSYERWGWELREDELLIRHGVVFRNITAIPVGRVQHVDVRQGPIEQWMGLARVHVHTASGVGSDGMIPGLEAPVAEQLRDQLVARSRGASQADDGV